MVLFDKAIFIKRLTSFGVTTLNRVSLKTFIGKNFFKIKNIFRYLRANQYKHDLSFPPIKQIISDFISLLFCFIELHRWCQNDFLIRKSTQNQNRIPLDEFTFLLLSAHTRTAVRSISARRAEEDVRPGKKCTVTSDGEHLQTRHTAIVITALIPKTSSLIPKSRLDDEDVSSGTEFPAPIPDVSASADGAVHANQFHIFVMLKVPRAAERPLGTKVSVHGSVEPLFKKRVRRNWCLSNQMQVEIWFLVTCLWAALNVLWRLPIYTWLKLCTYQNGHCCSWFSLNLLLDRAQQITPEKHSSTSSIEKHLRNKAFQVSSTFSAVYIRTYVQVLCVCATEIVCAYRNASCATTSDFILMCLSESHQRTSNQAARQSTAKSNRDHPVDEKSDQIRSENLSSKRCVGDRPMRKLVQALLKI